MASSEPRDERSALATSEALVLAGRAAEAHELLVPFVAKPDANIHVLSADAEALKSLGRFEEALSLYDRARQAAPASAVAEHNLAGVLGDLQRFAECEVAARRAFAKGLDAPETWLVLARAQQGLGQFDAAQRSYEEAIRRRPTYADALGDLSQLIWMRTGDAAAAVAPLDAAVEAYPQVAALRIRRATLLEYAGDSEGAYASLMAAPDRSDWALQVQAAQLAAGFAPQTAVEHARRAFARRADQPIVMLTLAQTQLAAGQAEEAAATASAMRERWPNDQHAIALLATAWRLIGDARYGSLYDYDRFVSEQTIDTPEGWSTLDAFLGDLAQALARLHVYRAHPIGQSIRGGSQTEQSLALSADPAIRAFFAAVDGPIRRRIAGLGAGADPLRARIADGYRFGGVWSVRLAPRGFHANHVHQHGWLSSACYVALPGAVGRGREGWLKLGEPGVATVPPLGPEHFVKPEPGKLVLFPSYMWHGTQPFGGDEPRLSIAFDLLPA